MHKSKINSLKLRAVWSHIKGGETLDDVHDSIVDAQAQADLLIHYHCVSFLDWTDTIVTVDKEVDVYAIGQIYPLNVNMS